MSFAPALVSLHSVGASLHPTSSLHPAASTIINPIAHRVTDAQDETAPPAKRARNHSPARMNVPEPTSVKYFVGQVPRNFDEASLRPIFEEYGDIYQLNVLRDKSTAISKGCCFVTFYLAEDGQRAQRAMHNKVTLAGMNHPIQMKPADTEKRNVDDRKLFVAQLPKSYDEEAITQLFSMFGDIDECTILRNMHGDSRGCSFVTFAKKDAAARAISEMNQSKTMDGATAPLTVRLADTQREKEARRQLRAQQQEQQLTAPAALYQVPQQVSATNPLHASALSTALTPAAPTAQTYQSYLQSDLLSQMASVQQQALQSLVAVDPAQAAAYASIGLVQPHPALAQHGLAGLYPGLAAPTVNGLQAAPSYGSAQFTATATNPVNPGYLQLTSGMQLQMTGPPMTASGLAASGLVPGSTGLVPSGLGSTGSGSEGSSPNSLGVQADSLNGVQYAGVQQTMLNEFLQQPVANAVHQINPYTGSPVAQYEAQYVQPPNQQQALAHSPSVVAAGSHLAHSPSVVAAGSHQPATIAAAAQISTTDSPAGRQNEGPDGANLFIYHLPQEFTDENLAQTFSPFGRVISAKVYVDQNTKLSKCFGFVSYDNAHSASFAIAKMNGFQVGMKRLKVQLKRPKPIKPTDGN